ncbi:MAG: DUF1059 domain-containing protein [Acidobacteria bacterium]|nr:DUF1059 domain-containing protein [Acidobacteriota bacterium]
MDLLELQCMACEAKLSGATEEELLAAVQEHVQAHGHSRPLTIEHIRSRLQRGTRPDRSDSGH